MSHLDYQRPALLTPAMKWTIFVMVVLLFGAGLLFVWPTPYRYEHQRNFVVRINRITGNADALGSDGWERLSPGPIAAPPPTPKSEPPDVLPGNFFDSSTTRP